MKIHFDETNLLAEMVGESHGATRGEIQSNHALAADALSAFRKRSESQAVGFPHLPFQTALIDSKCCKGGRSRW